MKTPASTIHSSFSFTTCSSGTWKKSMRPNFTAMRRGVVCLILSMYMMIQPGYSQSCFPIGSAWSGNFSGFSGAGIWQMTAGEDAWIKGILCQSVVYRDSSWNPLGQNSKITRYYYNDGEFLYTVQANNGTKNVLYRQYHVPGDTVLIPELWQGFGVDIFGVVLDTFSVSLIDSSWFAYTIEWSCAWESNITLDTITVIPGFGWWPWFSLGVPLGYMPSCGLFDGTYYTLSCAYVPGLGLYGDSPSCQALVDLTELVQEDQHVTILPNPAWGSIQIVGLPDIRPMRVQILDLWGRSIREVADLPFDLTISLDGIPAGTYQLLIWDGLATRPWTGQFVKVE